MGLEQMVYSSFKHEGVVNGDIADTFNSVPTWLPSTCDGLVHYIIRNKEKRLKLHYHD